MHVQPWFANLQPAETSQIFLGTRVSDLQSYRVDECDESACSRCSDLGADLSIINHLI